MNATEFRIEAAASACKRAALAGERNPPVIRPKKGKTCQGTCCIGPNKIEVYNNVLYINDVPTSFYVDSLHIGAFPMTINGIVVAHNAELSRYWKYP